MKRSYVWLGLVILVAAAAVTALGRSPSHRSGEEAAPAAEVPIADIALEIRDGSVTPAAVRVEKGTRVRLRVTNAGAAAATLALPGYEDRLPIPLLEAGARWEGEFLADRPGDDFAWVVNDRPAGRLVVSGSHLVEGHR